MGIICFFKCIFRTIIALVIIALMILAAIFIGATVQKQKAKSADSISPLYKDGRVCALKWNSTTLYNATSYNNSSEAIADGSTIVHCGECGACSNLQDYKVFANKSQTLYDTIMPCALRSPAGSKYVQPCLKERVNFTDPCIDCYESFITCGIKKCGFSCVATSILRKAWVKNNSTNDCLFCTERMCGRKLLECAGADRTRLNITSELKRPADEMCKTTSIDWMSFNDSVDKIAKPTSKPTSSPTLKPT